MSNWPDWGDFSHRQHDLHNHIARCTCCGSWEIITEIERQMRAADLMPLAADCAHLNPHVSQEAS